jgi:pimeloyl-ACP methyl ester carboxylesterase
MPTTDFIEIAGKKIQLTRGGQGPPLLYLHGAGGETDWLPFHEELGQRYSVYLPAHPGFGLSTGLDQIRDMDDLAWHYVDLLDSLGLAGVPVVGFSLGAWLACEVALRRPELFNRLVLIAAAGLHVEGAPMAELFIDDFDKLLHLLFFDPLGPGPPQIMPTAIEDTRTLCWIRAREATARVGWNPYLHNPKLAGHLHRIHAPAQVIWGRHDRLIPLAHGEAFARLLPQASLHVLEECGHMVPFEKAGECAQVALRFLQRP